MPAPGPNPPVPTWDEYEQLEAALHAYLDDEPPQNLWPEVSKFAEHCGLEVSLLPKSWYNLGSTVHIVFYPPERYR